MTGKVFRFLVVVATATFAVVATNAQTNLNTRKALYFTATKTTSIDLKNDVYVAAGATLHLSAELRTTCDNNICEFNTGVIATRSGTGPVSTSIRVQANGETFTKAITFAATETSKEVILPIKLKLGKNQIVVAIDPDNSTQETDENNSFSGTVMVSWKRSNPGNK
ncbi:MAG TPA: hypothetical protein VJV05_03855 [Pyrinomonadaceae bacterium]|nr:hypothetical protein [Pyrinomonadaceae bacterium]